MLPGGNFISLDHNIADIIKREDFTRIISYGETRRLVEIAIVDGAVPVHIDKGAAHYFFRNGRVEAVDQQRKILRGASLRLKLARKTAERRIGNGEQMVEGDAIPC